MGEPRFKVGDRVRVVTGDRWATRGAKGTVAQVPHPQQLSPLYHVEIDGSPADWVGYCDGEIEAASEPVARLTNETELKQLRTDLERERARADRAEADRDAARETSTQEIAGHIETLRGLMVERRPSQGMLDAGIEMHQALVAEALAAERAHWVARVDGCETDTDRAFVAGGHSACLRLEARLEGRLPR